MQSIKSGKHSVTFASYCYIQVRNHVKIYPWRFNRSNAECYLDNTATPYTDKHNINEFKSSKKQKKPWMIVVPKDKDNRFNRYKWNESYKSDPVEAKGTAESRLKRFQQSLKDRGGARESKPYDPPDNVQERILSILKSCQISQNNDNRLAESDQDILNISLNESKEFKFNLITRCIEEFQHDMPSSYLNEMGCINDVVKYFSTPVRGVNPYTALVDNRDCLPPNLFLLPEPKRYDGENDDFFQGYNALPGIISTVPGLRASKKYPSLNQDEFQWPDI